MLIAEESSRRVISPVISTCTPVPCLCIAFTTKLRATTSWRSAYFSATPPAIESMVTPGNRCRFTHVSPPQPTRHQPAISPCYFPSRIFCKIHSDKRNGASASFSQSIAVSSSMSSEFSEAITRRIIDSHRSRSAETKTSALVR